MTVRPPPVLSVIIPTLNEASYLRTAMDRVRTQAVGTSLEIIVADCGSIDGTPEIAEECDAQLVSGRDVSTRATACNAGAGAAIGTTLFFLHADGDPPARFDQLIARTLNDDRVVGGAFEFKLDGPEYRLRFVEMVNRIRYRCSGRYFGDQGIFIRRRVFHQIGGFGDEPILEDAHLCAKAQRVGHMRLVTTELQTSARRFYNGGILTTLAIDIAMVAMDLLGDVPNAIANAYQRDNIERGRAPSPRLSD